MYISHSQMERLRVAQWSLKNGSPVGFKLPLCYRKNLPARLIFPSRTSKIEKNNSGDYFHNTATSKRETYSRAEATK